MPRPSRSRSLVVATLLLASLPWMVAPQAAAQAPTAIVDASTSWEAGAWSATNPTCCDVTSLDLLYDHTYNLKVVNVDDSAGDAADTFRLCATTAMNSTACLATGNAVRGVAVSGQPGFLNLTFANAKLNGT